MTKLTCKKCGFERVFHGEPPKKSDYKCQCGEKLVDQSEIEKDFLKSVREKWKKYLVLQL